MQVNETLSEGLKHEFQILVPVAELDAKVDAKLADLKDRVRLNGFRPGKVPAAHLKKVYGKSVMAEAIDETVKDTNTKIFTDHGFKLAGEPTITLPTEKDAVDALLTGKSDLSYTVAFEVIPHGQAYTSLDEAQALGITAGEVVKTVLVHAVSGPVLVAVPGYRRLDMALVRTAVCAASSTSTSAGRTSAFWTAWTRPCVTATR